MQSTLTEFLGRWDLDRPDLVADTGAARVWKVRQADGSDAALKLYRRADRGNEAPGTRLLSLWQARGAVGILKEAERAVLMEWLDGPTLGELARNGQPETALTLLASVARQLHSEPKGHVEGLKPLDAVFAPLFTCTFADGCPDSLTRDMTCATDLARTLLATPHPRVPLHGDLHPDNVILTGTGPRVIDAKGYLGDPAFELANAMRHPKGLPEQVRQPAMIETCLTLYARALDQPRNRFAKWAAAKCALSIFWRANGPVAGDSEADLLRLFLDAAGQ